MSIVKDVESSEMRMSPEDIKTLELSLSKKSEEIIHLQSDVTRLQLEKAEAEASGSSISMTSLFPFSSHPIGKKFYEQLRALQKEIESEKRKAQEETNANSQQSEVESEVLRGKLEELNVSNRELTQKLAERSAHYDELFTQLKTLQVVLSFSSHFILLE